VTLAPGVDVQLPLIDEAPITQAERDEVEALVRWFRRRYPTPAERLAYVRRAYARWRRTLGISASR